MPQQDAIRFEIFPNPSSDVVIVRTMEEASLPMELIDAMGRVVLRTSTSGRETTIDLSGVKPGLYRVRAIKGMEVLSLPLMRL
jgi:hypothetical protein